VGYFSVPRDRGSPGQPDAPDFLADLKSYKKVLSSPESDTNVEVELAPASTPFRIFLSDLARKAAVRQSASPALTLHISVSVTLLAGLNRSWLSKTCAMAFAALIVLPVTEPFQTVSLGELAGGVARAVMALSAAPLVSPAIDGAVTKDTAVSTIPSGDGTRWRLKAQSRSIAEIAKPANLVLTDFSQPPASASPQIDQPPLVLRM